MPDEPEPPSDAVALYIHWQAAKEHREELERTLPPAGRTDAGGIPMPIRGPELIEADQAEHEASIKFHQHPWWYGAFNRGRADQIIEAAARARLQKQDTEKRPHPPR